MAFVSLFNGSESQLKSPYYDNYKLVILSSHRIQAVGIDTIAVYDLPYENDTPGSPINPVWKWPSQPSAGAARFCCHSLTYRRFSTKPIIWIVASYNWLHCLKLSDSGDPVEKHLVFSLKYSGMHEIGSCRGVWITPTGGPATMSTVRLQNPPTQAAFQFGVEDGDFEKEWSFDETSGRVALVVNQLSRVRYVYVSSVARLEMFKNGA